MEKNDDEGEQYLCRFFKSDFELLTVHGRMTSAPGVGVLVSIAYSKCGHTMEQYSAKKANVLSSENHWRTINSNNLTVFAASLQCTDRVKVVPRGTLGLRRRLT